jgi:hypothetical protein
MKLLHFQTSNSPAGAMYKRMGTCISRELRLMCIPQKKCTQVLSKLSMAADIGNRGKCADCLSRHMRLNQIPNEFLLCKIKMLQL